VKVGVGVGQGAIAKVNALRNDTVLVAVPQPSQLGSSLSGV
jgi:hypothetical protein